MNNAPMDLTERIARCLPAATYELETLVRLAGVHVSTEVETAAITCTTAPRLLVNPDFVAEHCRRDEHLFLLVMHELWHVILAHTTLYPRLSTAQNVAFDAVINAGLVRMNRGPEFRGFFEEINPAAHLPGALLRPPPGWPDSPRVPRSVRGTARRLVQQLYDLSVPMPTYGEILDVLDERSAQGATLLGNHAQTEEGGRGPMDDPLFGDVVRRIVATWPPPPFPLGGRDQGGILGAWQAAVGPTPNRLAVAAFDAVLRKVLGPPQGPPESKRHTEAVQAGTGVVPNARDRLAPARRRLGAGSLWVQPVGVAKRTWHPGRCAGVYLDVSGSMFALLSPLLGLLAPYVRRGRARLWQFSTMVAPLEPDDLRHGRLQTTVGTNIDSVFRHILDRPDVPEALVLTDGYTGQGSYHLREQVRSTRTRIHVVLPAESFWTEDLRDIAASMTVLPPIAAPPREDWNRW